MIDEDIEWHVPENLPHGGEFRGRAGAAQFFEGIGEQWEELQLDLDNIVSSGERVIALARLHGRLRGTGEKAGCSWAHAWTVRDGTRFGSPSASTRRSRSRPLTLSRADAVLTKTKATE